MSGHNKWSTIKHKKAKTDQQRGKIFSKLVREIMVAVKELGPDPDANTRLRLAIQKAKDENMPNDNIKRAIQKGAGGDGDKPLEEITFEGYGPNGVAILIETLTDNRNRTVPNIRIILNKNKGNLAEKGAVSYLFSKKGLIVFEPGQSEETIMEVATEAGADDIDIKEDASIEVLTATNTFEEVRKAFDQNNLSYISAEMQHIPSTWIDLEGADSRALLTLIDSLEDDDDVQNVYTNGPFSDETFQD